MLSSRSLAALPIPGLDPSLLAAIREPRLSLLWGTHAPTRPLLAMFTLTASRGESPRLFDGGNRFDGYFVARLARSLTPQPDTVLERLRLSRAFTCFQLAELIQGAPATLAPLFILDLLSTFYDESVPLRDAERLLSHVISHLKRLTDVGPVIVGVREPLTLVKERWELLDQLQAAADRAWMLRPPSAETAEQPRLL